MVVHRRCIDRSICFMAKLRSSGWAQAFGESNRMNGFPAVGLNGAYRKTSCSTWSIDINIASPFVPFLGKKSHDSSGPAEDMSSRVNAVDCMVGILSVWLRKASCYRAVELTFGADCLFPVKMSMSYLMEYEHLIWSALS